MNQLVHITTLEELLRYWPFFRDALPVLNSPKKARGNITKERLFKTLLHVALGDQDNGVLMMVHTGGNPLAFTLLMENTPAFHEVRSALCFVVYSQQEKATKQLLEASNTWCRAKGFKRLYAVSRRPSGAAVRLFESRWGFEKDSMVFVKTV